MVQHFKKMHLAEFLIVSRIFFLKICEKNSVKKKKKKYVVNYKS